MDWKTVACGWHPDPLGDRIEYFTYAQVLSEKENIDVYIRKLKDFEYFQELMGSKLKFGIYYENRHECNSKTYDELLSAVMDYPKAKSITKCNIELPERFVVSQWDARQKYRYVSKKRQEHITAYYKDLGYETVIIGGETEGPLNYDLRTIAYAISKAKYYVGCDSGMMHFAKMILPTKDIHAYVNLQWSSPGHKFHWENHPDKQSLSAQVRQMFKKGAKMNWCET